MIYNKLNFSISDRVEAAKTQTTDKTNTDAVPSKVNPSPGSSTITPPDTGGIDRAGSDVNSKQGEANTATSKTAVKQNTANSQNTTYDKQLDPEYPAEKDPGKTEPKPKNKTFTERLLDSQMQSMLNKDSGQPASSTEAQPHEYPKGQGQDINKPMPSDNTPSRPKTGGFNPAAIKGPNTQQPSGKLPESVPQGRPGVDLGPKYTSPGTFKPQNIKIRPITPPKFK
jgi:hypothetical protein